MPLKPRPPRLQGADLIRAVRGRLIRDYGNGSLKLRLHDAKSDIFALLCEVERLLHPEVGR